MNREALDHLEAAISLLKCETEASTKHAIEEVRQSLDHLTQGEEIEKSASHKVLDCGCGRELKPGESICDDCNRMAQWERDEENFG